MIRNAETKRRPRILMAEDDGAHLAVYRHWLTLSGCLVDALESVAQTLASLEKDRYLVASVIGATGRYRIRLCDVPAGCQIAAKSSQQVHG